MGWAHTTTTFGRLVLQMSKFTSSICIAIHIGSTSLPKELEEIQDWLAYTRRLVRAAQTMMHCLT